MKNMTKIAVLTASLLSMGALTACQSSTPAKNADHPHRMHGEYQSRQISPEQREQIQQMRAERHAVMKQIKQACDGKAAGQTVQVKAGEKTIDGTCTAVFRPDHKQAAMKHEEGQAARGNVREMRMQRGELLTDAKRAELTQQYSQRLAERQAKQQAVLKACEGQSNGKTVQIKTGTQTIEGKCEVRFKPVVPVTATSTRTA